MGGVSYINHSRWETQMARRQAFGGHCEIHEAVQQSSFEMLAEQVKYRFYPFLLLMRQGAPLLVHVQIKALSLWLCPCCALVGSFQALPTPGFASAHAKCFGCARRVASMHPSIWFIPFISIYLLLVDLFPTGMFNAEWFTKSGYFLDILGCHRLIVLYRDGHSDFVGVL